MAVTVARARKIVERVGIILVYPIKNAKEPPSLWSELHPKTTMRWEWDAGADGRVVELWHLKNELAATGDVAYAKWFRGRATFFSLDVFHALLARLAEAGDVLAGLPREATEILELLRERSPLSTKELRAEAGLTGKAYESVFTHAMKALWARLLLVGIGEVEDGAFPSLNVSATEAMFEDIWNARADATGAQRAKLDDVLAASRGLRREVDKVTKLVGEGTARRGRVDDDEDDLGPLERPGEVDRR